VSDFRAIIVLLLELGITIEITFRACTSCKKYCAEVLQMVNYLNKHQIFNINIHNNTIYKRVGPNSLATLSWTLPSYHFWKL
jgi:hypothetical protein